MNDHGSRIADVHGKMSNFDSTNEVMRLQRLLAVRSVGSQLSSSVATNHQHGLLDQLYFRNLQQQISSRSQPPPLQYSPPLINSLTSSRQNHLLQMITERAALDRAMKEQAFLSQSNLALPDRANNALAFHDRMLQNQKIGQVSSLQSLSLAASSTAGVSIKQEKRGKTSIAQDPSEQLIQIILPCASPLSDAVPMKGEKKNNVKPKKKKRESKAKLAKPSAGGPNTTQTKQDAKWLHTFEQLKLYKKANGDCIVPRGYPLNPRLASWVAEQRKQYKLLKDGKKSSITTPRVSLLTEIDFAWNAQEAAWERHVTELKMFKQEYGDCLVPLNHPMYPKLGLWVKEQRRHYALLKQDKPSHMTDERALALDKIGFVWDTHEAVWGERLRELCEFKRAYGTCAVPTNYIENPKLGTWVHHQRRQYRKYKEGKNCHITNDRIQALESIGFVWYPRERARNHPNLSSSSDSSESDDESTSFSRAQKRRRQK